MGDHVSAAKELDQWNTLSECLQVGPRLPVLGFLQEVLTKSCLLSDKVLLQQIRSLLDAGVLTWSIVVGTWSQLQSSVYKDQLVRILHMRSH